MFPALRKLFAALAIGALVGPTAAAACASAPAHHCEAAMHSCCEGPRLTQCECDRSDGSRDQSEPAQRSASVKADNAALAVVSEPPCVAGESSRPACYSASPPPVRTRERLSLLSTLLV